MALFAANTNGGAEYKGGHKANLETGRKGAVVNKHHIFKSLIAQNPNLLIWTNSRCQWLNKTCLWTRWGRAMGIDLSVYVHQVEKLRLF